MPPLGLTDEQLDTLHRLTWPLFAGRPSAVSRGFAVLKQI
jgi:hypothetical protein